MFIHIYRQHMSQNTTQDAITHRDEHKHCGAKTNYNMTVGILAGNYMSFTIAAGLIRQHMPGVKKSRV